MCSVMGWGRILEMCDNYRMRELSHISRIRPLFVFCFGFPHPHPHECVAFLRKTMRVREILVLVRLSHSHDFAQKHKPAGSVPK